MKKIKINNVDEYLYYDKLDNGLELYVVPNNNQKNFYMTFNTKFGSIDTEFKTNLNKELISVPDGIAHYIEHLMFNMENINAFDYFSKLGSSVNAFTTYDLTCYEVFSSTYFKENLCFLLDYVQTPYFTDKLIKDERGIITEEIKMYDNDPETELIYKNFNNIFINDKRKNLISGKVNDIKKITVNDIMDCYETFYNPNNMFIIITGNVNPYEALGIIEENQKNKEFNNKIILRKTINEPNKVSKEYEELEMNVETNKVNISYKIPKKNFMKLKLKNEELYVYISLIFNILFGPTSDIVENLITSKIILNNIAVNKTFTSDQIVISLTTDTDYPETLIKIVRELINTPNVLEEEIKRKIKVYKSNYILHFDDIESVNNTIQDDILLYNKVVTNKMDIYNNLNIDVVNKLLMNIKNIKESILIIKSTANKKS